MGSRTPRYDTGGKWFKGNTHIHSKMSDGGMDFKDIAERYAGRGYDFLFRTDHWVSSDAGADKNKHPLLWLDGLELDGTDASGAFYHVVCLGKFPPVSREMGFEPAMRLAMKHDALMILAHPLWSGNSLEDGLRWSFHGVETYNHVCQWLNGRSNGAAHWDAMLEKSPDTLAFASDDAHLRPEHPGFDGGWIMVNAPRLDRESVMSAIRAGNFYSSRGPEIYSITFEGNSIRARTSPVLSIRLVGKSWAGLRKGSFTELMDEAEFEIPEDWPYAYLEVEDEKGRTAWTNTLFKSVRPS